MDICIVKLSASMRNIHLVWFLVMGGGGASNNSDTLVPV